MRGMVALLPVLTLQMLYLMTPHATENHAQEQAQQDSEKQIRWTYGDGSLPIRLLFGRLHLRPDQIS